MRTANQSFIDGIWFDPADVQPIDVVDPSTEAPYARLRVAGAADVDRAVAAARWAFPFFSEWTVKQRVELLERVLVVYTARYEEVADIIKRGHVTLN